MLFRIRKEAKNEFEKLFFEPYLKIQKAFSGFHIFLFYSLNTVEIRVQNF